MPVVKMAYIQMITEPPPAPPSVTETSSESDSGGLSGGLAIVLFLCGACALVGIMLLIRKMREENTAKVSPASGAGAHVPFSGKGSGGGPGVTASPFSVASRMLNKQTSGTMSGREERGDENLPKRSFPKVYKC